MRIIDADAMLTRLEEWNTSDGMDYAHYRFCLMRINEQPTAEPRKGKWIDGNEGKWNTAYCPKCSVCGTPFYGIEPVRYHYCPNCGARMEE